MSFDELLWPLPRRLLGASETPKNPGPADHERVIDAWLLTCPQRAHVREETVAAFRETDWASPLQIYCHTGRHPQGGNSVAQGHRDLLEFALASSATHFLVIEDDVLLNRHLRHNLTQWELWQRPHAIDFATLYNPGFRSLATEPSGATFYAAEPLSVFGAQARLLSRRCAEHFLALPLSEMRQDMQFAQAAAKEFGRIWVHRPSLVQHSSAPSTWGGPPHSAADFDPEFRAPG